MSRIRLSIVLSMACMACLAGGASGAPITDASYFDTLPHTHITFEQGGNGAILPVQSNLTLPANEYAGQGLTIQPNVRLARDQDSCFRLVQSIAGGTLPYGLQAQETQSLQFNPPVSAFGFVFVAIAFQNATFTARDGHGNVIEQAVFTGQYIDGNGCGFLQYGFIGLSSATPIHRVDVSAPSGLMDDLRFSQTTDSDGDGATDDVDNCPTNSNPGQANADGDALGDACDPCPNDAANDSDGDGVCGNLDNCPTTTNANQANADGDGLGDACDACPNDAANDADGDGVCGNVDNCPTTSNANQANADGDGLGDACDACPNDAANDADGDGVCGNVDNCPTTANANQADADGDGQGDACDACPNDAANDGDGDGVCGDVDNCPTAANANQADADGDGQGDACDACPNDAANDADGDGVCGDVDNCPTTANANQADADGDGQGDACDACPNDAANDADGDGVCGDVDNCPTAANANQANADGDGLGDACDACPNDVANDSDGDGVCGNVDNCPTAANADQADTDSDGAGDACDNDTDNDGLSNAQEATLGTNPLDPDSDDDGLTDGAEVTAAAGSGCPSPLQADSDGDGQSDGAETAGGTNPCNAKPTADAAVQQLTSIGATAQVKLDGAGSTDIDNAFSTLNFTWRVNGNVVCDGLAATCATIQVSLSYGTYNVLLRVTDPAGGWSESSQTITLDPAQLSVFDVDHVKVRFDASHTAQIAGEIGLPFGVNYAELTPRATMQMAMAGITIAPLATMNFNVSSGGKKWQIPAAMGPVTKFDIDWTGARFTYQDSNVPVTLASQMISSSSTTLTVKYKWKQINAPFTINFNGQATMSVDAQGNPTATVPMQIEKAKSEVTLTLPFPLLSSSVITMSGGVSASINVGTYLLPSVGRFQVIVVFNSQSFPNGVNTLPRTLSTAMTVGIEQYPGQSSLGPNDLAIRDTSWSK